MDKYKISRSEIDSNNVKSAPTHNANEEPRVNKHIFDKLPELIAEKYNMFIDNFKTVVKEMLTEHDMAIGAGDMQRAVYDADGDGVVDNAKHLDGHGVDYFAAKTEVETAQATAEAAMPRSGGEFLADVMAYNENRASACLRNIEVRITNTSGKLQATNKIIMVRK